MIKSYLDTGIHIINIVPIEVQGKTWLCVAFEDEAVDMGDMMHLALLWSDSLTLADNLLETAQTIFSNSTTPLLRIHSECLLGDALRSSLCDCGDQLDASFNDIFANKSGAILYLRQEGRGIGMRAKLRCLAVQEGYINGKRAVSPMSSDEANLFFGHKIDEREYDIVTRILKVLKVRNVNLMTGNLNKIHAVKDAGVIVSQLTDINRDHILPNTRKHNELVEKSKRHYNYSLIKEDL